MGTRQRSKLPISVKSEVPNGPPNRSDLLRQEFLSKRSNKPKNTNSLLSQTPLSRLRKFKAIRDKNLRVSLHRKFETENMSVDVEKKDPEKTETEKDSKAIKEKQEKVINGTHQNGDNECGEDEAIQIATGGQNKEVNGTSNIEVIKKETIRSEVVTEKIDSINTDEFEVAVEDEVVSDDAEEEVEVVKIEGVLSRSFREDIAGPSSSKRDSPLLNDQQPCSSKQVIQLLKSENSAHGQTKEAGISFETRRWLKTTKIEGRRPLIATRSGGYRKRKLDEEINESIEKKQATSETVNTPSVLSPGWQFISSPFTRLWTQRSDPPSGLTPYKSFVAENDNTEDSMAVNFDDTSLYHNLNDSDLEFADDSFPTTTATNNNQWRCNIM